MHGPMNVNLNTFIIIDKVFIVAILRCTAGCRLTQIIYEFLNKLNRELFITPSVSVTQLIYAQEIAINSN